MHVETFLPIKSVCPDPLVLVAEISHRVLNEYSQAIAGINLAARRLSSAEAQIALTSAASRLRNYADVHRALQSPASGGTADLAAYLGKLCAAVVAASLQERGIRLTLVADEVTLSAQRCWRVALVMSELITNGVRHGLRNGEGDIVVGVGVDRTTVTCRVTDNGIGPSSIEPGRGVSVVSGLAFELGGVVTWRSDECGTTAELVFPRLAGE